MEASPDAGICHLFGKHRHVRPTVGYARGRWTCYSNLRNLLCSESCPDDACDGAAEDAMRAWVFRVHRRVSDRLPSCITFGGRVGIDIAIANCRDRSPEIVVVLGIEHGDQCVVDRNRRERHKARSQ